MAQKLDTFMPGTLILDQNYIVQFTAVDATTGAVVTAVRVSNASLLVENLSGGPPEDLATDTFFSVAFRGQPIASLEGGG